MTQGFITTSFRLTPTEQAKLVELSEKLKVSKTRVLTTLINNASINALPVTTVGLYNEDTSGAEKA